MLSLLNVLVQLAAAVAGVYIGITNSAARGAALFFGLTIWHWLLQKISDWLMKAAQSRMTDAQKLRLMLAADGLSSLDAATPPVWRAISMACGLIFLASGIAVLWWSLSAAN